MSTIEEKLQSEYSRNYFLFVQSTQNNDKRNQLIQATRLELLGRLLNYKKDEEVIKVINGI